MTKFSSPSIIGNFLASAQLSMVVRIFLRSVADKVLSRLVIPVMQQGSNAVGIRQFHGDRQPVAFAVRCARQRSDFDQAGEPARDIQSKAGKRLAFTHVVVRFFKPLIFHRDESVGLAKVTRVEKADILSQRLNRFVLRQGRIRLSQ